MDRSCIFVVGTNLFQNNLMASSLQEKTGVRCLAVEAPTQVKIAPNATLALYDCMGATGAAWLNVLDLSRQNGRLLPCLFNVDSHAGIEKEAVTHGARGFFYVGQPFSQMVRGVRAILQGDFWVPRCVLSDIIQRNLLRPRKMYKGILTGREEEVLTMLAGGAANEEIAAALCISKHTVKNHLQKIYRKINARGKVQAALWASENLE